MYDFLTSSFIHSNELEACAVKNTEVIKLSQIVGIALDVSYTHLGVFLQLTNHEFHICSTSTLNKRNQNLNLVKNARVIKLRTVVSVMPCPQNFLIYACAILLPWLQRLRNWEVINRSTTSNMRNVTHSNNINMVTGYKYVKVITRQEGCI